MKIRTRIITTIIITTLCVCAVLFVVLQSVITRNYASIENNQMQQNLDRIQFALTNEQNTLVEKASSWGAWDDTYQFVIDGNSEYIQDNFNDATFINEGDNVFAIVNNSGTIIYAGYYDFESEQKKPLSTETLKALSAKYLLASGVETAKSGFLTTNEGPLLIGTYPILTSKAEGPVRGTMIVGLFLNDLLLDQISSMTKLPISVTEFKNINSDDLPADVPFLTPEDPISIQPLSNRILAGYYLISDLYGKPYLVAITETARDVYYQASMTIMWLFIGIFLMAVLMILVIIRFLERLFLSRLSILSDFAHRISQKGDFSVRVSVDGKDELRLLGDEINAMLSKLSSVNEELADSENRYSSLVEGSYDGITIFTNEIITYANSRMLQLLGISEDEYLGSHYLRFINKDYHDEVMRTHNNLVSGKPGKVSNEIELDHKSGLRIPVEIHAKLIKINRQDCLMVVFRDITEHKLDTKKLEQAYQKEKIYRQELEKEARTRTQFIDILAHELRNPLTPLMASLEMGRDSLSSDPTSVQYKLFKNALDGSNMLRDRLEELLDMVRFSQEGFTLTLRAIDTTEFLKSVALRYKPALVKKQQIFILNVPVLPGIMVDYSRLEQVIVNLLSNASKYSPKDSQITLQASVVPQGILVEIKDQGIGIPQEELVKIFELYHRVEQTRQDHPGIGLGLTVCQKIIEAHKGRIWVESEMGKGSTFKFILPLDNDDQKRHK